MAKVKFEYGNDISNAPFEEGSIRITPNTQSIYFDLDNKRFNISDLVFVDELPEELIEDKLYIQNNGQIFTKINNEIVHLISEVSKEDIEELQKQIEIINENLLNREIVKELPSEPKENTIYFMESSAVYGEGGSFNKEIITNFPEEPDEDTIYFMESDATEIKIIDDENISEKTTYSSEKIENLIKNNSASLNIPPKNPTSVSIKAADETLKVYWTDPEDNIVDGTTLATWGGTILVINDDHAPQDENDGTIVVNNTTRNAYTITPIEITGLENNKMYYLYFVPYTATGIYGYSDSNRYTGMPAKLFLDDVTDVTTEAGNKTLKVTWTNPSETKTENDITATWVKTTVVVKADGYPASETDGIAYESTDYSEGEHEFEVENGYDYYVRFFVESDLGSVKQTDVEDGIATYATLTVTTEETTLIGQEVKVSWTDGEEEKTLTSTFGVMSFAQFKIPFMGEISLYSTDGEDEAEDTYTIETWGAHSVEMSFLKIVTFADGTWKQIIKMCEADEAGKIDISDYWAIGDTKENVPIAAMEATGVGESHAAQTSTWVIVGIHADTIASGTYASKLAAITIGMLDGLDEVGYMNPTRSNYTAGSYFTCSRYSWLTNTFEKALPADMQKGIQDVEKTTYVAPSTTGKASVLTESTERCFLFSYGEIFGDDAFTTHSITYFPNGDGTQYEYYKTTANRIKKVNGSASKWWGRSGLTYYSGEGSFTNLLENGTAGLGYQGNSGLVIGTCF